MFRNCREGVVTHFRYGGTIIEQQIWPHSAQGERVYSFKRFRIAMFMALGQTTRVSRRGHSIVFVQPVLGQYKLSTTEEQAKAQIDAAGLELGDVTPAMENTYDEWCDIHRYGREARFVISRKISLRGSDNTLVPATRVWLTDRWGDPVTSSAIPCLQRRNTEVTGSVRTVSGMAPQTDYPAIHEWIASVRQAHPEFREARIVDVSFPEPPREVLS